MNQPIPVSSYVDYLDMLPIEQLREEARGANHDCRREEDGTCPFCSLVEIADKEKLLEIIENNVPESEVL